MRDKLPSRTRRTLRAVAATLAAGAGLAAIYSCSLIVDTQSQQCQADSDCAMFGAGAVCNTAMGVCTQLTTGSSGTTTGTSTSTTSSTGGPMDCDVDGGVDGGGCYAATGTCAPTTNAELLNACSDGCIPFDDTAVKGLLAGGALPPLPTPPDGGL